MDEINYTSQYVLYKVKRMLAEKDTGRGKAILANLRRGIGKEPGELPELWGVFLESMPEKWMRKDGKPSREEWGIYIALTMFALHQQGHTEPMHCDGESLGGAVRRLVDIQVENDEERVLRRLKPLITANNMPEVSHYLRNIIQLLSAKNIPLDYGKLSDDLVQFQSNEARFKVKLRWGQDFYRKKEDK